jgi:hypothetical protein
MVVHLEGDQKPKRVILDERELQEAKRRVLEAGAEGFFDEQDDGSLVYYPARRITRIYLSKE